MITYEEFLRENNITELNSLRFSEIDKEIEDVTIQDDAKGYIDVAKKADKLKYIVLESTRNKRIL